MSTALRAIEDPMGAAMEVIVEGIQARDERSTALVKELKAQTDLILSMRAQMEARDAQMQALEGQMHELKVRLDASETARREESAAATAKIQAQAARIVALENKPVPPPTIVYSAPVNVLGDSSHWGLCSK